MFDFFGGGGSKSLFLNPFLHFFQKVELSHRKIVQINMFPKGLKNSATIAPPPQKRVKHILPKNELKWVKKGYFWGKPPFSNAFLHLFKQIELNHRKTVQINIFPEGIKNLAAICLTKRVPGWGGFPPPKKNS